MGNTLGGLRDFLSIYGPGLVFIALSLYVTQHFIKPAPPREVTIATGQSTGAYYLPGARFP